MILVTQPVNGYCYADSPVQVRISDRATSPNTAILSLSQISNPAFRAFVSDIYAHFAELGHELTFFNGPQATITNSSINFIRIPITSSGSSPISAPAFNSFSKPPACAIRSPWVDIYSHNNDAGDRIFYSFFYWNERQILNDQAILGGMNTTVIQPTASLARSTYESWSQTYARFVITSPDPASDEALLAEGVPLDILWLFRNSPQSTRGPFSDIALGHGTTVLGSLAHYYANLVVRIASACLHGESLEQHVNGITDALESTRLPPPDYGQ